MNKCVICGKFKKWKDLILKLISDTHFTSECSWYECKLCIRKENEHKP